MVRARSAILQYGGAARANVFTRLTLAMFGQLPWRGVPYIPVEIMLLPKWFPFHLDKVSYWSRTVMVPLFVLWFGIFEGSKITLIAVGVFFPVYLGVMGAIMSVDRKLVEVGRAFRLSDAAMVRRILLPAVLPAYVLSLRAGLGLGWMFVIAAEFMGASEGLGYLLIDGQQLGKPAQILAAIVIFAILGKTTDWLIEIGSAPLLRWQDAFGRQGGGA